MAIIADTGVPPAGWAGENVIFTKHVLAAVNDTTNPVMLPAHSDISVQVFGSLSTSTVTIQGSNETSSPSNWSTLNDSRGETNGATFTAADLRQINESPVWIRATLTAGTDTNITVCIKAVRRF